jgi:hypothetical protein
VLTAWALEYARQGYPVFPVRSDKVPLVKWSTEATTDPDTIKSWWRRWPLAMIGMPTGTRSGLVVVDVDVKNGVDGFQTLKALGFQMPRESVAVITPSGGYHFYFRAPEGEAIPTSAGKIGPGVDIRAEGGMIILPPSRPDIDGMGYDYACPHGPDYQDIERGQLIW